LDAVAAIILIFA